MPYLSLRSSVDGLGQDVRHAFRRLWRAPAFTAVAVVTLALAIGANSAIFSLANALIFRDLAVKDASELTQISLLMRNGFETGLSFPAFDDIRRHSECFSSVIAWTGEVLTVEANGVLTHSDVSLVTGNFYTELGTRPFLGRLLTPNDTPLDSLAPIPVAILGYGFWQQRFGGDPSAVGSRLRIEGATFTIVGIAPRGFRGLNRTFESAITVPLTANALLSPDGQNELHQGNILWLNVVGRRRPSLTIEQARAQVTAQWPGLLAATMPVTFAGARRDNFLALKPVVGPVVSQGERQLRQQYSRPLVIVMAVALFVLLIACVTLANLMLARTAARRYDIGVQLALGATRWRVARPVLVEGVLVSIAGGVCGMLLAPAVSAALGRLLFVGLFDTRPSLNTNPDGRVLLLTVVVAMGAGLLFSVVPAWRATRHDAVTWLVRGSRTVAPGGRLGRTLVVVQIALTVMLLVDAGLLVRTLQALRAQDLGFQTDGIVAGLLEPRPGVDPSGDDAYLSALVSGVSALPGVRDVSLSFYLPAAGASVMDLVASPSALHEEVRSAVETVAPGFFHLLGMTIVAGRDFAVGDRPGSRPVIISRSLARRLFGGDEAIGQSLRIGVLPAGQNLQVVGVVSDAQLGDPREASTDAVYQPIADASRARVLLVRGRGVTERALDQVVDSLGRQYLATPQPLAVVKENALIQQRLIAMLAAFFGALVLALASIGVQGLMSTHVGARTKEFGIRLALGATPGRVLRGVLGEALRLALLGTVIGLGGTFVGVQVIRSLVVGVTTHDVVTLTVAPLVLLAMAIVAGAWPALRAARISPMAALRAE